MNSWMPVSIAELCQRVTSGGTPRRDDPANYAPATVPWIKTGDLRDGVIEDYNEYISEAGVASSAAKVLPAGTVLMAMYGATVGRLGWMASDATCNQAACAMIVDPTRASSRWLFYALLQSRDGLISLANGAAQQNLNSQIIKDFSLIAPPLAEQRAIAEVLGALDDKIAANAKLIGNADHLAEVRYDALVAEEADARPLSSLASFVNGKAFTKDASGTGRVVIRIAELNSGLGGSTVYNDIDVADQHLARPGDLLFAWSGSLTVHRWYRPEAIVNQHIFKVVPTSTPKWAVNGALRRKLAEFKAIAADKATTMGHIQRHHLDENVLIPTSSRLSAANDTMVALWDRALLAERENRKLAEVRDALLPQLMLGRIWVKDAERAVGEVV